MGLALAASGAATNLEDLEAELLRLFEQFGINAPEFRKLCDALYASPSLGPAEVVQLHREFQELRAKYQELRLAALRRTRNVQAKDPAVAETILLGMLAGDRLLTKIDDVLRICDAAVAAGGGIVTESD